MIGPRDAHGGHRRRSPRPHEVLRAGVVATATALGSILLVLALVWVLRPGAVPTTSLPKEPETADVSVDRVLARLPDGREALGSFTLRFRGDAVNDELRRIAAMTPTPDVSPAGVSTPIPREPSGSEALLRDRVGNAMTMLSYEQVSGVTGKERLRTAIRSAVNDVMPGAPVTDVYIREFLVK